MTETLLDMLEQLVRRSLLSEANVFGSQSGQPLSNILGLDPHKLLNVDKPIIETTVSPLMAVEQNLVGYGRALSLACRGLAG